MSWKRSFFVPRIGLSEHICHRSSSFLRILKNQIKIKKFHQVISLAGEYNVLKNVFFKVDPSTLGNV